MVGLDVGQRRIGAFGLDPSFDYPDVRSYKRKLGLIVPVTNTTMEHELWDIVFRNQRPDETHEQWSKELAEWRRMMIETDARRQGITLEFPAVGGQYHVKADHTRVKQVLIDLLPVPEYLSDAAAAMARDFVPNPESPGLRQGCGRP